MFGVLHDLVKKNVLCVEQTYLNSRSVLNLNGDLFSVDLHLSGVQVACDEGGIL